jgi:hypothetical protein
MLNKPVVACANMGKLDCTVSVVADLEKPPISVGNEVRCVDVYAKADVDIFVQLNNIIFFLIPCVKLS